MTAARTAPIKDNAVAMQKAINAPARLPCRGCTATCTNYVNCEGKPWRMN